jgi:hypothetical protein
VDDFLLIASRQYAFAPLFSCASSSCMIERQRKREAGVREAFNADSKSFAFRFKRAFSAVVARCFVQETFMSRTDLYPPLGMFVCVCVCVCVYLWFERPKLRISKGPQPNFPLNLFPHSAPFAKNLIGCIHAEQMRERGAVFTTRG